MGSPLTDAPARAQARAQGPVPWDQRPWLLSPRRATLGP